MSETNRRIKQLEKSPKLQPKEDNRITVFIDGMTTDPETGEKINKEEFHKKYGEPKTVIVVKYEDEN